MFKDKKKTYAQNIFLDDNERHDECRDERHDECP